MVIWLSGGGGAIGTLSQAVVFRTLSNFTWFFVVVGFLAGLGYWIVAGRHAGRDGDLPESRRSAHFGSFAMAWLN